MTDLAQNAAAIMATRNVNVAEAVRIATLNAATTSVAHKASIEYDETLEYLMLQLDLLPNNRKPPKRQWRGMGGHSRRIRKQRTEKVVADDARQVISIGGTQADFD